MITTAILSLFGFVVSAIAFFLPAGEPLPDTANNALYWLGAESYKWDYIFPITTIWIIVGIMVPVLIAYFAWNAARWFVAFIRGN